jgi:hypothetical protein
MYLREHKRNKDGKEHRYFSVEESRRLSSGKTTQRRVLYLGEINDTQKAAWQKTLDVFDESREKFTSMSLFPDDREIPPESVDSIQVKLSQMQLRRPRQFGNCWLGCELWRQLNLDEFWGEKLPENREQVPWERVLQLLVVNRLIAPGSEFRLHRQWFDQSAMAELLGVDFAVAAKDRLYRCLDRIVEHKKDLFIYLKQKWQDLFGAEFDVLLYDLTSTYFEGEAEQVEKAKRGYSRDHRPDCKQVVIALVITPEGFPLSYEVMDGNRNDKTTLREFLKKIEDTYGKARRVWVMDRGIPTEEILTEMRGADPVVSYLVGTQRGKIQKYEKRWLDLKWKQVRQSVEVKLFEESGELYVLAKSEGRQQKEMAIRRRKLVRLLWRLLELRHASPSRDQLLQKLGAAKKDAGRAAGFVTITIPKEGEAVSRKTFRFSVNRTKLDTAELRDGHYLLRSNLVGEDPEVLWDRYVQLTQIEAAFKSLKSDLGLRPIYHWVDKRVEAHILVAFLAYCLTVTLKKRLEAHAPGLTPRAVLEKLATIQMLDVHFPTTDGRELIMPRYTEPEPDQKILLEKLKLFLPQQPPPKIRNCVEEFPAGMLSL